MAAQSLEWSELTVIDVIALEQSAYANLMENAKRLPGRRRSRSALPKFA
jgi:hypothetical protein